MLSGKKSLNHREVGQSGGRGRTLPEPENIFHIKYDSVLPKWVIVGAVCDEAHQSNIEMILKMLF